VKKNLTNLFGLFVAQMRTAAVHYQHSVKVLVGQIAVIECPIIAVYLLYHQMVRVLAGVLIPKSIGFAMIAQLRGLLSQSLPPPSLQRPNVQWPNVQQAFMFLEKQPLFHLT
jgi:hypothetical protein